VNKIQSSNSIKDWKDLEIKVLELFLNLGFDARKNVKISGLKSTHNIDVLAVIEFGGLRFQVVVECKFWKTKVKNFKQIDEKISIHRGPEINLLNNKSRRPDFIIEKRNQKVIIEVKTILRKNTLKAGLSQLENYLKYTETKEGILFALSKTDDLNINNKQLYEEFDDFKIVVIIPKDLN